MERNTIIFYCAFSIAAAAAAGRRLPKHGRKHCRSSRFGTAIEASLYDPVNNEQKKTFLGEKIETLKMCFVRNVIQKKSIGQSRKKTRGYSIYSPELMKVLGFSEQLPTLFPHPLFRYIQILVVLYLFWMITVKECFIIKSSKCHRV